METLLTPALIIFALTYLAVAVGEIPGLALDRTGMAVLGAVAMVALAGLTTEEAIRAIDFPTILLLFGLMVVSSQFRLAGFYTHLALAITRFMDRPRFFLLVAMAVSAGLSAVLANDIVCLAFTPVLGFALLQRRLNPLPFLLGLAISSNIGSAATIIGNPQNMLIGQLGRLHFGDFLAWCLVPSLVSLALAYLALLGLYRQRWTAPAAAGEGAHASPDAPDYDRHQSRKGFLVTLALVGAFFTPWPRESSALVAAGILLCSRRMQTRAVLGLVDWHLITLFCGLFIVIRGLEMTGAPARVLDVLAQWGWDLGNPYTLAGVSVVLSNLVSNVPATMLLVKFLDPADPVPWYVLALSSTFAGNLITIGSIANLITMEQARTCGIRISFREHARAGVVVTLASLAVLAAWIALAGRP